MSLEAALIETTAAIRELIATLSTGTHIGAYSAANTQEETSAKKPDTLKTVPVGSASSGEPSASTQAKSSAALKPWREKTAQVYADLKGADPTTLESARKAVLAINSKIDREQAEAVLARFGADAVTAKKDGDKIIKRGLDAAQYPDFFALCLEVLAGRVDATEALGAT